MEQKQIVDINSNLPVSQAIPTEPAQAFFDRQEIPTRSQIVILGGGLAGLISSIVLAREGRQVLLCEKKKYPRDKVCGACLNSNALATLERLKLTPLLDQLGAPMLKQVRIQCGPRTLSLPLPSGRAVTRKELDLALANEATRCGVRILENVNAALDVLSSDQKLRRVRIQDSQQTSFTDAEIVLVAAGLGGVREFSQPWPAEIRPNSKIGIGLTLHTDSHNIRQNTIYLCVRENGYLGIVLAENHQVNLAAAIKPDLLNQEKSFAVWVRETLRRYNLRIDYSFEEAQWRGTAPLTRKIAQPFGSRWLAIGDSAGYVEPFTGEGMAWAMSGGEIAASLAAKNLEHWSEKHERQWGCLYKQMIRQRQWSCRSLAWLLQNPLRSRLAIEVAAWFPGIGQWFIHDINRLVDTPLLPKNSATS